jgi:PAS domain S-box-containing protein
MPFTLLATPWRVSQTQRRLLIVCRVLSYLLILSGLLALLGWATHVEWLTTPIAGWRGMVPGEAVCSMALGIALQGRIQGRVPPALLGAVLAFIISVLALLSIAAQQAFLMSSLPLPSAILVATAAVGLLGGVVQARPEVEKVTLGLAGVALIALTITIAFAQSIGLIGFERSGTGPGSSFQLVTLTLLLGICFVALVWASGMKELEPPEWLPAATGLVSLLTIMSLWSALSVRERTQRLEVERLAAVAEERLLTRGITAVAGGLRRAAEQAVSGVSLEQQEGFLATLQRDMVGLESIFRLAADGTPLVLVPLTADAGPVIDLWITYLAGLPSQPDTTVYLPLDSAARRFVVFVPVCTERCRGAMAGVMRSSTLFLATRSDSLNPFRLSLAGPAGALDSLSAPAEPAAYSAPEDAVPLEALGLKVTAVPGRSSGTNDSGLPGTVLFMGLIVTLLLPLTMQFGRSAWEGARARAQARLSLALDRATDGVWELDVRTGQTVRSPQLWRHLHYAPETVPPDFQGWAALIHPEDRAAVDVALSGHLLGERESYETEYRVKAGDGSWHTVVDRGRVVDRTLEGTPSRVLGISADVTEARAAARARAQSERLLRAVFDSSFQFQILLSSDGSVLEVNQMALTHAGTQGDTVVGRPCWDTLWWLDNPGAQQTLRASFASAMSGATEAWEQEIRRAGRPPIVLELSLKPVSNATPESSQLLLEGRDITERRRSEAALQEVDTLTTMGRVVARVAHEINNPLAGIQSAFLLIKDAIPRDHPHFVYVGAIEREIERISRVTRQLYETYRPEQDPVGVSSVQLVVTDAVVFLHQVNRVNNVKIETDLVRVPNAVPVPAAMLRQIVYNLVQNAIDVSPPGGRVQVIAATSPTALELIVRDQGPGIPEVMREQVFEAFFSTKEKSMKTSGMGLGLALVRRTVAAAGGTIRIETAAEGGAEFIVTLPLRGTGRGAGT